MNKNPGFTTQEHDAAGLALWSIDCDLVFIKNVLSTFLPHTKHKNLFRAFDMARTDLFKLRSILDDKVARETRRATDFYLRGSRSDSKRWDDSPPSCCTKEEFQNLAEKLKALQVNNCHHRKPGVLGKNASRVAIAALQHDCLVLIELAEKLHLAGYPTLEAIRAIRAFIVLRGEIPAHQEKS